MNLQLQDRTDANAGTMTTGIAAFHVLLTAVDPNTGMRTAPFSMTFIAGSADQARDDALSHPHAGPWCWHVGTVTEVPLFPERDLIIMVKHITVTYQIDVEDNLGATIGDLTAIVDTVTRNIAGNDTPLLVAFATGDPATVHGLGWLNATVAAHTIREATTHDE